ncbi:response regulator [Gemmatimonadota bacterium Y43]
MDHIPPSSRPDTPFLRTPVAVVIDEKEWNARSLASILGSAGYAVVKAFDEAQALDLLARMRPDAVFMGLRIGETDGMALLQRVRSQGLIDATTPVIGLAPNRPEREARLAALRGGAWEVVGLPFDADELLLRLGAVVRAKQASDAIREDSLVDAVTGFYNTRGVLQRLSELRSAASRRGGSMACIVVGPRAEADDDAPRRFESGADAPDPDGVDRIRRATRRSDAKGTLSGAAYVVVAPDTDAAGALRLAERIVAASSGENPDAGGDWVAGLFAEADLKASSASASDFLTRATEAFRSAQSGAERTRVFGDPREN